MPSIRRLARDVAAKIRLLATARFLQGWQWFGRRSLEVWQWLIRNPRIVLWVASLTIAAVLVITLVTHWSQYKEQREALAPLFTLAAGLAIAGVTLMRHFAQTDADRQRRITESYGKAVGQLASEKIEERLGGIYTLERISRESRDDYWTIMETLTAFVRERARWKEPSVDASETMARFYGADKAEVRKVPPTDIDAVFTVIRRRPETERNREKREGWRFDFRDADLRGAQLPYVYLEGANFENACLDNAYVSYAHFEGASFSHAHLERAVLWGANLERANLAEAHLERADCSYAHFEGASLSQAHLEGAVLWGANLEYANLAEARLEGIDLRNAQLVHANLRNAHLESSDLAEANFEGAELKGANLEGAEGDAKTRLPDDVPRPTYWPAYQEPGS
jgi:uncharacterized protein YjbI with pentapeptide repeats